MTLFLLLFASAATLLALVAFVESLKRKQLFAPDVFPAGDWGGSRLNIVPRDVTIPTPDGLKLHGWLFAAQEPSSSLIIWFHGNAGNLTSRAETAAALAGHGLSTLLFDYRGYGKSDGNPSEDGLHVDSLAAFDSARAELDSSVPIFLYGESLGGPYAARVAVRREVSGIIIENSFPSLRSMARIVYPGLPLHMLVATSLTTQRWLNAAGKPVLVIHGERDEVVPFSHRPAVVRWASSS